LEREENNGANLNFDQLPIDLINGYAFDPRTDPPPNPATGQATDSAGSAKS
jgi:hypothetical protein